MNTPTTAVTAPKKQYCITLKDDGYPLANIFLTELLERPDRWEMRFAGEFIGFVWKRQATIEMCAHEAQLDALAEVK